MTVFRYERIIRAMAAECWAILPAKLEEMIAVVESRAMGEPVNLAAVAEIEAARRKAVTRGAVAVLPLFGSINHRAGAIESSMGTSAEAFGKQFDALMNSSEVGGIIMDIDSPGGSVRGIQELTDKIRGARGQGKQIVAVANAGAFSAAYSIATAADELIVTPSGAVGSVGVLAMHVDESAAMEAEGVKVSYITAGKFKVEGNSTEPLQSEAREQIQKDVDHHYAVFVDSLAKNRDTTTSKVRRDFGEGRTFNPKEAVERNMADRVATLETVIAEMTGRHKSRSNRQAERDSFAATALDPSVGAG